MLRCPRCPNGAVICTSAAGGTPVQQDAAQQELHQQRPTTTSSSSTSGGGVGGDAPYVDISLTLSLMPSELKCRNCGWTRNGDGTVSPDTEAPYADSSTDFSLMPMSEVPLHPGLDAGGRNDDSVQRLMRFPGAVLCTVCGGPSARVEDDVVKTALTTFKNLPQPPNDIASRASWWGFQSSNFAGRPVILEWYYVVTRAIDGSNAQQDDLIDLCIGCGRCCYAKYIAPREVDVNHANKTAPLPADWADKQKERELESRRRNPKYKRAQRAEDGTPIPGTGGMIDPITGKVVGEGGGDDEEGDEEDDQDNDSDTTNDNDGMVIRRVDPSPPRHVNDTNLNNNAMNNNNNNNNVDEEEPQGGGGGGGGGFAQTHDHTTGATVVARNNAPTTGGVGVDGAVDQQPAAVIADPEAVKAATVARLVSVQQVRILEEARRHIVTHLEDVMGPPSTWPRTPEAVAAKQKYRELWELASMVWLLASSSPTRSGAMLEWSIARDFLIKTVFKTEEARKSLDTLFPRDPRDADILVWSEKWIGVHARSGALIFARRLHEYVPLNPNPPMLRNALRDAVAVANRTRALRMFGGSSGINNTNTNRATSPGRDAAAASASATKKIAQPHAVFADSRIVRFPLGWITPHAWKSMQARAFRFAMFVLRQAELDGKNNQGTVYLVAVKLMLRFMADATALTEHSFFSLVCGLPYNDDETREFVVLDFRDERLRPQVRLGVDRLIRISRGANWDPPNAAWSKSLIWVCNNPAAAAQEQAKEKKPIGLELVKKLSAPETISVLKVVACHEDVRAWNA